MITGSNKRSGFWIGGIDVNYALQVREYELFRTI